MLLNSLIVVHSSCACCINLKVPIIKNGFVCFFETPSKRDKPLRIAYTYMYYEHTEQTLGKTTAFNIQNFLKTFGMKS